MMPRSSICVMDLPAAGRVHVGTGMYSSARPGRCPTTISVVRVWTKAMKREVWSPGSTDTVCPRRPVMVSTALGQDGSDWSCELATLAFDLGGHGACGWCGLSSSIRVPNLKFVGLGVLLRYGARCVSALMGPVTLTFDLFTLKLVCKSRQRRGTFFPNLDTPGLRVLQLFAMYAMDGWTDGQKQRFMPPPLWAGA